MVQIFSFVEAISIIITVIAKMKTTFYLLTGSPMCFACQTKSKDIYLNSKGENLAPLL